ncbi:MAG: 16S rRNA (cytidine(1402)-2'-O)-methyltransferase [Pseudomonadota bacterium]
MPLTSPTPDSGADGDSGVLYVVATPIGNQEDITLRALKILNRVDGIAAEDTRHTGRFLSHHGVTTRLISYHEHNERIKTPALINQLVSGESLALVTDAGTPAVSDPGYRLVKAAVESGIQVVPVPGVSAAITALSVGGLPTDSFIFVGFPAKKTAKRIQQLQSLAGEERTLIFYESPKRITAFLAEIKETLGNRNAVLGREMTKLHEEFLRGAVSDILEALSSRSAIKGECTLLVAGKEEGELPAIAADSQELRHKIAAGMAGGGSLTDVSRELSALLGISRKKIYEIALKIKNDKE